MSLALFISVANVDAKAEVTVGGNVKASVLFSAIPSDYFSVHIANTYNYPVYDYGQLILSLDATPGNSMDIQVKNIDGKTATTDTSKSLPAWIHWTVTTMDCWILGKLMGIKLRAER